MKGEESAAAFLSLQRNYNVGKVEDGNTPNFEQGLSEASRLVDVDSGPGHFERPLGYLVRAGGNKPIFRPVGIAACLDDSAAAQ